MRYEQTVIVTPERMFLYANPQGYIHCHHEGKLHKVVTAWGNVSYICDSCGKVARRELTPTSL